MTQNSQLAEVVDASPHFRGKGLTKKERAFREDLLVEITDRLLAASILDEVPREGSYSIDGTNVDSWARPRLRVINTENGSVGSDPPRPTAAVQNGFRPKGAPENKRAKAGAWKRMGRAYTGLRGLSPRNPV